MRREIATMVLAAAIGPVLGSFLPRAMAQDAPPPVPAAAAAPAQATAVPVKRVVLYTSGVGYFEHYGTIHGDANTVLSFKTDQINDVLKSLLLEDLDGGRVTGISYPTLAPLAQTLRSFQVDLSGDPPLAEILKQLRGAQVTATLPTGPVSGEVLGVEKKDRPVGTGADAKVVEVWIVNLLNDSGISPVELDKVSQLKLDDPELAAEMQKALAALALSRDKDKKPVTISFSGQGDHRVRIGYVVETPIWKASYRLSLGEGPGGGGGGGADSKPGDPSKVGTPAAEQNNDDSPAPSNLKEGNAGKDIPADQQGKIQGWAIVDNQTDNDWTGVELSLVSGRPISFIEDLYQPLYVPRPTVQPDLFAGLQPRTYEEGMETDKALKGNDFGRSADGADSLQDAKDDLRMAAAPPAGAGGGGEHEKRPQSDVAGDRMEHGIDLAVAAQASGAKVGEAFEYTVHDVSLARQKSSMIPILAGAIRAQRLSIYNQSVLPNNPLLGARLTNTSGEYIMQGPLTVLDHGIYAGDAQILDMPPDQQRLISYGVDQRMLVSGANAKENTQLLTGKIVKGVLELTDKADFTQTFVAKNNADVDKTLLIEEPRRQGWDLITPGKPAETTDTLYRFEVPVPAGKSATLAVQQQHTYGQAIALLPIDASGLIVYSQNAAIPQPVKDALVKAAQLKGAVTDTDRELAQLRQDKSDLANEQDRMRRNMSVVSPGTDYYKKLLQKLDDQETQFEKMEAQEKQLVGERHDRQKQFEDYLSGLTVG